MVKKTDKPAVGPTRDALALLHKMEQMHDTIDGWINAFLESRGWSRTFIKEHLENPNNFAAAQEWTDFQKKRQELMSVLTITTPTTTAAQSKPLHSTPAKRSKTRGQRRHWLTL